MARNPSRGRSWSPPPKQGGEIAVDLNAKDGKAVDRNPEPESRPAGGRRPGDGRGGSSVDSRVRDPIDRQGMSRSMQKRIARARAEGERLGRQRFADEQAESQREISDLRKRLHGIEINDRVSKEEAVHDASMRELEQKLEKAHTDGDHAAIATLTREMNTKAAAWEQRKRDLLATPIEASTTQKRREEGPTPEGRAWIAANADWYNKPGYEAETSAVIAIDQELMRQDSDPNSPEHYRKIQREMKKRFRESPVISPYGDDDRRRDQDEDDDRRSTRGRDREDEDDDLDNDEEDDRDEDSQDLEDDDDERGDTRRRARSDEDDEDSEDERDDSRRRRAPPSMLMGEGEGDSRKSRLRTRGGKIILSERDKENMRRFGHDPDNDQHVLNYAKTQRELANNEDER